jgi:hypothetical protein
MRHTDAYMPPQSTICSHTWHMDLLAPKRRVQTRLIDIVFSEIAYTV